MTTPKPWERQAGELDHQFEAFRIFRDLPPQDRTIARVALRYYANKPLQQAHKGPPPSETPQHIWSPGRQWFLYDLSRRKKWRHRVALWDAECDRIRREQNSKAMTDAAQRHAASIRIISGALIATSSFTLRTSQDAIADYERRIAKAKASGRKIPVKLIKELQEITAGAARLLPALYKAEREAIAIASDETHEDSIPEPVLNQAAQEAQALTENLTALEQAALAEDFEAAQAKVTPQPGQDEGAHDEDGDDDEPMTDEEDDGHDD